MKVLALDIGEKRIGIAVGDTETKIAIPLNNMSAQEVLSLSVSFRNLVGDHEPELLLVGLPLTLAGQEGKQAQGIRRTAQRIAASLGIPLAFEDERLSSAQAKRYLREAGFTEKEMRGKIDMLAASIVLQAFLDTDKVDSAYRTDE